MQKGQRIVVTGRLRVRDWTNGDKTGTNVELDADALGHDLSWGTAAFTRSASTVVADAEAAGSATSAGETVPRADDGWATPGATPVPAPETVGADAEVGAPVPF